MHYVDRVLASLKEKNPNEAEFHQAATEILNSLRPVVDRHPEYEKTALLERFVEPERVILFRVPWVDDGGNVHVNKGYRVQFSTALPPDRQPLHREIFGSRTGPEEQPHVPSHRRRERGIGL